MPWWSHFCVLWIFTYCSHGLCHGLNCVSSNSHVEALAPNVTVFWERAFRCFPGGSDGKESACNAGDLGSIPGLGRSPGEENSYQLQYSGLENSMDRGVWQATVLGVAKSWTRLSDFHFHFRWWSQKGRLASDGTGVLIARGSILPVWAQRKGHARTQWLGDVWWPRKESSPESKFAGTMIVDFQTLELWDINVFCATQSAVLCYGGSRKLRQPSHGFSFFFLPGDIVLVS